MPKRDSPEALREYHRNYMRNRMATDPLARERHHARVAANNARYLAESRALVAEFRKNGCGVCGEFDPSCLDAHHRDPLEKDFNVASKVGQVSPTRLAAELAKCVCICANCHRKFHAGKISLAG